MTSPAAIDLSWLPLGAGGHSVRLNGRVYEALLARRQGRPPRDLYHAALEIRTGAAAYVIEVAPVPDDHGRDRRGVVASGPVGARWAGRWRLFRYEVRCWPGGAIPDLDEAVESPVRLSDEPGRARRMLELVARVPTPVWGRDELRTGDMWNSNSVVSWLVVRSGLEAATIRPPAGGRAPGWDAGVVVARRQAPPAPGDSRTGPAPG
ncbi:hypothetical protein [Paraconexibacter sp.]|uniref:hypothetical protein n=1 Tax=Paraconexibacter sp. TaxID=2949640 RepID=UPI0035696638